MATKSIPIEQLRVGMYVSKLDVSWFRSPFLRHRFLVQTKAQIEKLRRTGITRVTIDLSRGDDVETLEPPTTPVALDRPLRPSPTHMPSHNSKPLAQLNEEYAQAQAAKKQLAQSIHSIFDSLSERRTVDRRRATEAIQEVGIVTRTMPNSALFMALSAQRASDVSLSQHALSTCTLALVMGQSFGLNPLELQELGMAALLHDIGLLQIPANIIQRSANTSNPLPKRERHILESHPQLSILALERQGGFSTKVLQLIGEHHVRLDDSGYPQGTRGEFTSERSRILAIADHYDELITGFGGASPLAPYQALQRLYRESQDGILDQTILSRFIKLVGIYPVHSRVRLTTQEQAVVTALHHSSLHQPVVTITHTAAGIELQDPLTIDLAHESNVSPERAIETVLATSEPLPSARTAQAV